MLHAKPTLVMVVWRSVSPLLLVLSAILCMSGCSDKQSEPPNTFEAFTEQLDQLAPELLDKYRVPGMAAALVHNGKVAWARGYGLANKSNGTPVTTDTVFQLASISKSITAWGIMRLVETGKIDLDVPVEDYLTSWHLPDSDFDHQEVTIRRLLSHTAGLAAWDHPGVPVDDAHPSPIELLSGADSSSAVHVDRQPGQRAKYSNGGYVLLQLLMEEVSGEPFSEYMQREIFDPLRMDQSSFQWLPELRQNTATGYDSSGKAVDPHWYPEAAGGLYSTAPDMATWLAAGMPGTDGEFASQNLLQPQTLEQMVTRVSVAEGNSDGLGYAIEILPNGMRMILYSGDVLGWRGQYAALPDQREGIVVLTNSSAGRYAIADMICVWARWAAGTEPKACQVYHVVYLIIPGIAILMGLGIAMHFWRFFTQVRSGERELSWPPITPQQRRDIFLPFVAVVLWWSMVEQRIGRLMPPGFTWISLGFTLWCLVTIMKGLTIRTVPLKNISHNREAKSER